MHFSSFFCTRKMQTFYFEFFVRILIESRVCRLRVYLRAVASAKLCMRVILKKHTPIEQSMQSASLIVTLYRYLGKRVQHMSVSRVQCSRPVVLQQSPRPPLCATVLTKFSLPVFYKTSILD